MGDRLQSSSSVGSESGSNLAIPDHHLLRRIGSGSYGEVWLARSALGTYRAVKIVYEKTFRHKRPFEREFNGVQKFEPISRLHDGLVDVLHVGRDEAGGYFYSVMELADDVANGQQIRPENYSPRTLACDMAKHKRLPVEECRRIGHSIAAALGFLHSRGLIHRDIKPSNIIFVDGVPKLADIGLVAEISEARSYVGTEGFIPPEGPGAARADIYSLGKVLYEISTGKDRHDYPELPTHLGPEKREMIELNKIILTACRSDPNQRYSSAAAMASDLGELRCREHTLRRRVRRFFPRAAWITSLLAVAGLVAQFILPLKPDQRPAAIIHSIFSGGAREPAPAPTGLVAWWRAENSARDLMGGDGQPIGNVRYAVGEVGQGFQMDGSNSAVLVKDSGRLALQNFTIEAWVQRGDAKRATCRANGWAILAGFGTGGYEVGLANDGVVALAKGGGEGAFSPPKIIDTKFHHIAVTKAGNVVVFYIDGAAYPAARTLNISFDFTTPFFIGGDGQQAGFLGKIDELSIYDQPLYGDEIQAIYQAGSAGKLPPHDTLPAPASIVGWWRAEDTAKDSIAGHKGILYGVGFARGKIGRAFDFDPFMGFPSPYRVLIPDHNDFKLTRSLTIEGWILSGNHCGIIFHRGDDRPGLDPYSLETVGNREVRFQIQSLTNQIKLAAPIAAGEWTHVAATLDDGSGDMKLYVNGEPKAATNTSVRPFGELDARFHPGVGIGNAADMESTNCFDGLIDEIALYSRALSAAEIQSLAHSIGGKRLPAVPPAITENPAPAAKPTAVPAPPGLMAWWPGEGDAKDIAGHSDGILLNHMSFAPGMVGQAFRFDGIDDYVQIPRTPALDPGEEVTLEFWMKADPTKPMNSCCQGLVTTDNYQIEISPGWTYRVGINFIVATNDALPSAEGAETAHANDGGALISSDEWHHIAGTYDGRQLQLYVDGEPWGKPYPLTGSIAPMRTASFLAIGSAEGRADHTSSNRYFKGLIDEVSLYNRALSPAEIALIYHAGSAGKIPPQNGAR